jgi:aryl-alcohol dehydrogenase-like predicted oxidoreductase
MRKTRWEDEVLPTCRALGIGFVPYSPLGRGFLTGRFRRFAELPEDDFKEDPRDEGTGFHSERQRTCRDPRG